jgi:hypothetical protein
MGDNEDGQLGDGTTTDHLKPIQVASNVNDVSAGFLHNLYLKSDGALWGMGSNEAGQLGGCNIVHVSTTTDTLQTRAVAHRERPMPLRVFAAIVGFILAANGLLQGQSSGLFGDEQYTLLEFILRDVPRWVDLSDFKVQIVLCALATVSLIYAFSGD